jgi:FG-GAP repeat
MIAAVEQGREAMRSKLRSHVGHNLVGYIAVFVALRGTAMTERFGAPRPLSRTIRLTLAATFAVLGLVALPPGAHALEQKLVAADGAADDQLAFSVAIDGDTAVLGAPGDDGSRGAVYVFTRSGGTWAQTAKLTASDGAADDQLGHSVATDGDIIIAGAPLDDVGATPDQGSAYTFARTGAAARTETAKLTASDGAASDFFGISVAIDGDTIIAGAPLDDVDANLNRGSAYTFARTGAAARTETAKLTASDGAAIDQLGVSVAIEGDTIVAGALLADAGANLNRGAAYTFARTGAAARTETAKLTASDGAAIDFLGDSVAIEGDTIVATAPQDAVGANLEQGSAYTFARTGAAARTETAKLTASDGEAGDLLGGSVAIEGDTIVAGAPGDAVETNPGQGSAYTFARTGAAARTETAKLTASDGAASDFFGSSVAIDGDTIVAGAPGDDVGATPDQGSASAFAAGSNLPPDCSAVAATPGEISPARRDLFETVTLDGATDPDGDQLSYHIDRVTQDEPVTGTGDATSPDARLTAAGAGSNQVELRSERNPQLDGRVYRIAFTVSDDTDSCSSIARVDVPRKKDQPAVDSAPPSIDSFTGAGV